MKTKNKTISDISEWMDEHQDGTKFAVDLRSDCMVIRRVRNFLPGQRCLDAM